MDIYNRIRDNLFLIAGPCVIENESNMYEIADFLVEHTKKRDIFLIFKASYLKANRTSINSYRGPGLEGLEILKKIKEKFKVPVLTDVHETSEIAQVAEVADIIQIPAFLARQTFLIQEAAKTKKIINVKKGQFMAPEDMKAVIEKISDQDNRQILLTERGTSFGYHNLVVDFRGFSIMHSYGYPVVYDVTHSLQKPSISNVSGGTPEFVPMMIRAALATGYVNGLFLETHPNPEKALSDAASMVNLNKLPQILDDAVKFYNIKGISYEGS